MENDGLFLASRLIVGPGARPIRAAWPAGFLWGNLRRQFFAMRQMVAVPACQSRVAGVFKKKLKRWRLDMAVAKDRVGFALMASQHVPEWLQICHWPSHQNAVRIKPVADSQHVAGGNDFRLANWQVGACFGIEMALKSELIRRVHLPVFRIKDVNVVGVITPAVGFGEPGPDRAGY